MLKTNSKKAKENIQNYILNNYDESYYVDGDPRKEATSYKNICDNIYHAFIIEYVQHNQNAKRTPLQDLFVDWCSGLPSIIDTCYYYNREAKEDLMQILEETPEETDRYTEADAERLLSVLLYREIINNK